MIPGSRPKIKGSRNANPIFYEIERIVFDLLQTIKVVVTTRTSLSQVSAQARLSNARPQPHEKCSLKREPPCPRK